VDQVLEKFVQALGGIQRLVGVTTFVATGTYQVYDDPDKYPMPTGPLDSTTSFKQIDQPPPVGKIVLAVQGAVVELGRGGSRSRAFH
jgi:hypothetical protein